MKILWVVALSVACAGAGQVLLASGAGRIAPIGLRGVCSWQTWIPFLLNARIMFGLLLWAIATLAWLAALTHVPLSYVYCLGSVNYIVVPLAGRLVLREELSIARVLAMCLICSGVFLSIMDKQGVR